MDKKNTNGKYTLRKIFSNIILCQFTQYFITNIEMATFFEKLTHKEVSELQNMTQNILQSCQEGINLLDNMSPDEKTSEFLFNELCNRNTIITQLANMTIFILEQISRCIHEKEELLEQNMTLSKKNENQNNSLLDAKDQIEQLLLQNMESLNKCQTLINERDFINERNQCLNTQLQRLKNSGQTQRNKFYSQLEYLNLKVLNQDQKLKDNEQLLRQLKQKNQQLEEDRKQIKKELDVAMKDLEETRRNLQKLNQNPVNFKDQNMEDVSLTNFLQKENIQIIDDNIVLQQKRSNLKLELMDNIQVKNYQKASARSSVNNLQNNSEESLSNIKQKSISQKQRNDPKLKKVISISGQSDIDIDIEQSFDHFQHQSLQLQPNDQSILKDSVKDRVQTQPQNTEIQTISKNKQPNVSRIKFLMKKLGGKKDYVFKKKGKNQRFKTERSQQSRIQGQKLRNTVLDKKGTVETSTTETIHLSRRIFQKRSPS